MAEFQKIVTTDAITALIAIADAEFHARKIKRQPPIRNGRDTQQSRRPG